MMSTYYYATLENDGSLFYNNRFDLTEGVSYLYNNPSGNEIELNESNFNMKLGEGVRQIGINSEHPNAQIKLSCYYYFDKCKIPDGNFATELSRLEDDLGEYYCLFTNPKEFLTRIDNRLKQFMADKRIKQYDSGLPEYKSIENMNGFTNPFQKPDGLSWQNEYRIVVNTVCEPDPFIVNVNGIMDISVCGKTSDLLCGKIISNDTI